MKRIALTGLLVAACVLVFQGGAKAEEIQGQVVTVMPNANTLTLRQAGENAGQTSSLVSVKVDPKAEFKGGIKSLQDITVGDSLKVEGDKSQAQAQGANAFETYDAKKIEKVAGSKS